MQVRIVEINNLNQARTLLKKVGVSQEWIDNLAIKSVFRTIYIEPVRNEAANILKQEMLAIGGEAAIDRNVCAYQTGESAVLLMGTLKHYSLLQRKLALQPFGLKEIGLKLEQVSKEIHNEPVKIMGILNVTPDSFSDGGKYFSADLAVKHGIQMIEDGADIIDIGGESTRPGAELVAQDEELRRIIPVIKELHKRMPAVTISVDTYKSAVAKQALDNGANMVNDISGLTFDQEMLEVVTGYSCPVIIMHIQGTPRNMQNNPQYTDVVKDIYTFFQERIDIAIKAGVKTENIYLDPGIGFGKTVDHNLEIIHRINEFCSLGYPIVLGTSNKSFIGKILGSDSSPLPTEQRNEGNLVTYIWSVIKGTNILRVHDVKPVKRVLKMLDAIKSS